MWKWSQVLEIDAECLDCDKHWDTANAMGVAAQHARKYNHHVVVVQTIQTSWEKGQVSKS